MAHDSQHAQLGVIALSSLHVTGYAASCDSSNALTGCIRRLGSIHIESLLVSLRGCDGIHFLKEENECKLEWAYSQEGYIMPSILRMITESVLHISDVDTIGFHEIGIFDKNFTINIGYNESNLNINLHQLFSRAFTSLLKELFNNQSNSTMNPCIDIVVPSPLSIKGKDFIVSALKSTENTFDIKINNIYSSAVAIASTFLLSNDSYNLLLRNNGHVSIAVVEIGEEYTSTSIISLDVAGEGLHHKTNIDNDGDDDDVVLEECWINEYQNSKMPSVVITKETCSGICDFGLREGDACIIQSWFQDLLDLYYNADIGDKKNTVLDTMNGTDLWFTLTPRVQGQCLRAFLQFRKSFGYITTDDGIDHFQLLFDRLLSFIYQNVSFMLHSVTDTKRKQAQTISTLTISIFQSTFKSAVYTRGYKLHDKLRGNDLDYVLSNSIRTALSRRKYVSCLKGFDDQIDAIILWQECVPSTTNGLKEGFEHKPSHLEDDIIFDIMKREFNDFLKLSGKRNNEVSPTSGASTVSNDSVDKKFSLGTIFSIATPSKNIWSDVASTVSSQSPMPDNMRYDVRWKVLDPHTHTSGNSQDSITPWLYCDNNSLLHGLITLKQFNHKNAMTETTNTPAQPIRIYQCLAENIGVYITDGTNNFADVTVRDIAWIYGTGETYLSTQKPSIHALKGDAEFGFSYNIDQSIDLKYDDIVYWTFRPSALTAASQYHLVYFQGTSINITETCNIEVIFSTQLPFLTSATKKPAIFHLQIGSLNGVVSLTLNHEGIQQNRNASRKKATWTMLLVKSLFLVAIAWLLQSYIDAHVIDWMR